MPLAPGTRLGPYEILAPLGAGGMGEVVRAKDPKLGREVAIKVLPEGFASDADQLKRFEQEARTLSALNHPNILTVFDLGSHEGTPYLVMELLEGETLREKLGGRSLPSRKATEIALQVAKGLSAAHAQGILHRDLKPENLFVCRDGRVKILDFGLAKLQPGKVGSESATRAFISEPGTIVGTSGYMSPEQVQGEQLDARSDLFSLGVVLWEMLTGRGPFRRDSAVDSLHAILREEAPDLDPALKVPPGLVRILDTCLAKDPAARFHSAHDLAFALENASESTSSAGRGPLPARRWNWRAPALVLAGAAMVLAWVGLAHTMRWPPFRDRPQPTFQRLTFRRGNITVARFAPDGKSILFSATLDWRPSDVYHVLMGSPDSRALGIPVSELLSVSRKGELAVRFRNERALAGSTILARVPMVGGTPRELLEDIRWADWGPDGEEMAVVRQVDGRSRLEWPLGTVRCELPNFFGMLRVSPTGREVAWLEVVHSMNRIQVMDRNGRMRSLDLGAVDFSGLAWSGDGRSLFTSWGPNPYEHGLWQVPLKGKPRLLHRGPKSYLFHDADAQGRLLVELSSFRNETLLQTGAAPTRDVSWMDACMVIGLGRDGEALVYWDLGEASGPEGSLWIRNRGNRDPVRIGDGAPVSGLSPDGKWVAAWPGKGRHELVLLPTGLGQSRTLPLGNLLPQWAAWSPDGRRLLLRALDPDGKARLHFLELEGGRMASFQGMEAARPNQFFFSPDGRQVVYAARDGKVLRQSVEGGAPEPWPIQLGPSDVCIQLSRDGQSLFVLDHSRIPGRIEKVELATGRRTQWKDVPIDPREGASITTATITPDGNAWTCSYNRVTSCDLYLVEGLK